MRGGLFLFSSICLFALLLVTFMEWTSVEAANGTDIHEMAKKVAEEGVGGNGEDGVESRVVEEEEEGGEGEGKKRRKKVRHVKITRRTFIETEDAPGDGQMEGNGTDGKRMNGTGQMAVDQAVPSANQTSNGTKPAPDHIHTVPEWDEERAPVICGDHDWHYFDGFCYKLVTGDFNWEQALDMCKNQQNASLVSIQSRQENEFVSSLSTKFDRNFDHFCDGFWIGMTRKRVDPGRDVYKCEWSDGTNVTFGDAPKHESATSPPWRGGQPDNTGNNADGREECVQVYPKMGCDSNPSTFYTQWNDYHCSAKLNGAVCKKRKPIQV